MMQPYSCYMVCWLVYNRGSQIFIEWITKCSKEKYYDFHTACGPKNPFKEQYLTCISHASSITIKIPLYRCQGTIRKSSWEKNFSDIIRTRVWDLATVCRNVLFIQYLYWFFNKETKAQFCNVFYKSLEEKNKRNVNVFAQKMSTYCLQYPSGEVFPYVDREFILEIKSLCPFGWMKVSLNNMAGS